MAQTKINIEEWLAEITRIEKETRTIEKSSVEGYTVDEFSTLTNSPKKRILDLLKAANAVGRIKVGREQRVGLVGQKYWANIYKILPVPKSKKNTGKKENH